MATFATPQPIIVTFELAVADLWIDASDRPDTVVHVHPSNPGKAADVRAAEQTRVEYSGGRLLIKAPKPRFPIGGSESIDVTIELPSGSQIRGDAGVCSCRTHGRLGEFTFKNGVGAIDLETTGSLNLNSGSGDITVDDVAGRADVTTGNGSLRMQRIDGPASIKNSNGYTFIGEITGELRLNSANGQVSIDRARSSVTAKTANGSVRIGEVARGSVLVESGCGDLEVGVREGSAAWLDVSSKFGNVRNALRADDGPRGADETVEVRAHTNMGDITICRSIEAVATQ